MQPQNINIEAEERRIDKMHANSYAQRRLEGRPNHTMLSQMAVIVSGFVVLLELTTYVYTDWKDNYIGTLGYSTRREWGVLGVKGTRFQTYSAQKTAACTIWGEFHVLASCVTPLCEWYQLKCITYMTFEYAHLAMAVVLALCIFMGLLVVSWLVQLTPRTIRLTFCWSIVVWIFHTATVVSWVFFTDMFFDELMELSYYPSPFFGIAFGMVCAANAGLLGLIVLSYQLKDMWPEPDDDDDDDDDEDSDDDEAVKRKMMEAQQQQQTMMMQQQGGMQGQPMMMGQQPMSMPGAPPGGGAMMPQSASSAQAPNAGMQAYG